MGIVYKAHDPKINRFVAIKTISLQDQITEGDNYRARFFYEAEAAGRLSHPGIVTIFDAGEDPDTLTPYIVMEYVSGQSLEEVLSHENGKLPLDSALQLTQELAEALDYAHAQGIVHRDIKPSNIIMTEDGRPKIADFGIAKLNIPDLTQPGRTLGTPAYMSPEQFNGNPLDGRSDLFSLGVVLYRLITGHRPFQGNSALTISFKVVNRDPVPATAFDAELAPELDYVIARAIAKNLAQRYQTGMEMALDLQDLRGGIAPRSRKDAVSPEASRGEDLLTRLDQGFCQSLNSTVGVAAGTSNSQIVPSMRKVAPVQFSPWQQVRISFLTLGLLVFAFVGLWQAIPVKAFNAKATASGLPIRRPNETAVTTRGLSDTESRSVPVAKARHGTFGQRTGSSVRHPNNSLTVVQAQAHSEQMSPVQAPQEVSPSTLCIAVEHHFGTADLSVWIDDKLSYTYPLHGIIKKRMLLFGGVRGYLSDIVPVTAGEHRVRVRVLSADNSYDEWGTIAARFAPGSKRILTINFKKNNRDMHLSLE